MPAIKLRLPFYEKPNYPYATLGRGQRVHMMEVISFLNWVVESDNLEIADYFKQMTNDSFFLVAATGLGKTVGVPPHVLIRQIQRTGAVRNAKPRVWIVEPRIPIAIDQTEYMNALWYRFQKTVQKTAGKVAPLFGQITSQGRRGNNAPIQFVTTGIFELFARNGEFDPVNDRVVIDEAHVTVEQNPSVELGIALCRQRGVTVDYMSATVDVTTLQEDLGVSTIIRADQARGIIWKSNLYQPIVESVVDLLQNTLVVPDPSSRYYPDASFRDAERVIKSAIENGRSHGMLIVVNSFNGSTSDIKKLSDVIRKAHPGIAVLHLASDVIRNPRLQSAFKRDLRLIEERHGNYVILSTSVVEMGITFPTLDYVVTMDSGYDQETIGDVTFPVVAPLGVNSLLQRIGRVGRRRPGIAYISNEVGAPYSSLEPEQLNANALSYEPIIYPLASAPLMPLAYYCATQWPDDLTAWLAELHLPSRVEASSERMAFLREQFEKLELLGITDDNGLTNLGVLMRDWIGRADIAYATQLQKQFAEGASADEVIFWVVSTALSTIPVSSMRAQYGYFIDFNKEHNEIAHRLNVWRRFKHEDIVLFHLVCRLAYVFPGIFWATPRQTNADMQAFHAWCNWAGIDGRKLIKTAQGIRDAMKLFVKVNGKSERFASLFPSGLAPERVDWKAAASALEHSEYAEQLRRLSGMTEIVLTFDDEKGVIAWRDTIYGHEGLISQDDTPIRLSDGFDYTARVVPSRRDASSITDWRLTSIGKFERTTTQSAPAVNKLRQTSTPHPPSQSEHELAAAVNEVRKRSGFVARLFGR